MLMDRRDETLQRLKPYIARARAFSGWSFTEVASRPLEPGPPWDYEAIARDHARAAKSTLDLGTGGGEVLERIVSGLNRRFTATEEWQVNAPIARRRLAPLGGSVLRCSSLALPFVDSSFDLVLDRHEALEPAEVVRVLRPGGHVITQQVISELWPELTPFFPHRQQFGDHFTEYASAFEAAGLTVQGAPRAPCRLCHTRRRRLHAHDHALDDPGFRSSEGDRRTAGTGRCLWQRRRHRSDRGLLPAHGYAERIMTHSRCWHVTLT